MERRSFLWWTEALTGVVLVAIGWGIFADQLVANSMNGSTIAWLLAFLCLATFGGVLAVHSLSTRRHALSAAGLVLVAATPTFFAYALNVVVLLMTVFELAMTIARHSHAVVS